MKKSVLIMVNLLFLTAGLSAQNQFSLNIDSTKTGLLSFNKQSHWPLSSKESIKFQNHNFLIGPEITDNKKEFESNMPIHKALGNYPMVIHIPDSTIDYKIQIVEPYISDKFNN